MPRIIIEISLATVLTLAAIIASAAGASASDVMVSEAFARASATQMAKSGAAYLSVVNHGAEGDRLLSVSTPAARKAEIHTTVMEGEVMKMEPAGAIELSPHGTIEMKPGGLHVMMTGLKAPLKEGGLIEFTLVFEKAGGVKVLVPVGAVAAGGHGHASGVSTD